MKEYSDYDLSKLACEKLLGVDFSKRPYEGRIDPINDWGVLGHLMIKYKVEIDRVYDKCTIWDYNNMENRTMIYFPFESEIPRAIIMCILKSKNII